MDDAAAPPLPTPLCADMLEETRRVALPRPLALEGGETLEGVEVAYESWGKLNAARSNAVLVCHALTGDQYAACPNPVTGRPAWWPRIIGPGLPLDTDRYFVVATNVLGGCMGTTGPVSEAPDGKSWGARFPVITVGDMVAAQRAALEALGISELLAVVGGSMGGMQALEWARAAGPSVRACAAIATAPRHSAQNIAFYEVGRQAITSDPDWHGGAYLERGAFPVRGLKVARMAANITYLSEQALRRKFDRGLQDREAQSFTFDADFQVESYLRHTGKSFTGRFDANAYLYITRAMDYFDIGGGAGGMAAAFRDADTRFALFSFSSDWHYPPGDSREIARALIAAGAEVSLLDIETDKGHDAFFLEEPVFEQALGAFIASAAREARV